MKHLFISIICVCIAISAHAQVALKSPCVESNTLIINNSGFKAVSIRTTPVARPTPMHVQSDAVNVTFPSRFIVAKADVPGSGSWAWANGWNASANTKLSGVTASIIPTGCAAYFEVGVDAIVGKWRLPTQREMLLIMLARHELATQSVPGFTPLGDNTTYWISSQYSATQAWIGLINYSASFPNAKTSNFSARCIRDL